MGYDNSLPMLERARRKTEENQLQDRIDLRHAELNGRLSDFVLENASVITMLDRSFIRASGGITWSDASMMRSSMKAF